MGDMDEYPTVGSARACDRMMGATNIRTGGVEQPLGSPKGSRKATLVRRTRSDLIASFGRWRLLRFTPDLPAAQAGEPFHGLGRAGKRETFYECCAALRTWRHLHSP